MKPFSVDLSRFGRFGNPGNIDRTGWWLGLSLVVSSPLMLFSDFGVGLVIGLCTMADANRLVALEQQRRNQSSAVHEHFDIESPQGESEGIREIV